MSNSAILRERNIRGRLTPISNTKLCNLHGRYNSNFGSSCPICYRSRIKEYSENIRSQRRNLRNLRNNTNSNNNYRSSIRNHESRINRPFQ